MNLTWERDNITGDIKFHGVIHLNDLLVLELDYFEMAQLEGLQESAADFLLDAELIFRRYAEQQRGMK